MSYQWYVKLCYLNVLLGNSSSPHLVICLSLENWARLWVMFFQYTDTHELNFVSISPHKLICELCSILYVRGIIWLHTLHQPVQWVVYFYNFVINRSTVKGIFIGKGMLLHTFSLQIVRRFNPMTKMEVWSICNRGKQFLTMETFDKSQRERIFTATPQKF